MEIEGEKNKVKKRLVHEQMRRSSTWGAVSGQEEKTFFFLISFPLGPTLTRLDILGYYKYELKDLNKGKMTQEKKKTA